MSLNLLLVDGVGANAGAVLVLVCRFLRFHRYQPICSSQCQTVQRKGLGLRCFRPCAGKQGGGLLQKRLVLCCLVLAHRHLLIVRSASEDMSDDPGPEMTKKKHV